MKLPMYNKELPPGFRPDLFVDPALASGPFSLEKSLKLFLGNAKSEVMEFPPVLTVTAMAT
jgi:hypothetical protein